MAISKTQLYFIVIPLIVAVTSVGLGFAIGIIPYNGKKCNDLWRVSDPFSPERDYAATIDMGDKEQFVILNLADIQLHTMDTKHIKQSFEMLTELINTTHPDLITLTGDQVSGGYVKGALKKICKFIDSFGIPWAPVLGNHDGQGNVTRNGNGDIYLSGKYKNVIFRKNDPSLGMGNYIINITKNGQSVHNVFMIDSHDSREYENGKDYDYIWYSQIAWYEWAVQGIAAANGGNVVPSSCYFHIPLVEYRDAYEGYKQGIYTGGGVNREPICCADHENKTSAYNSGLFAKIKELNSTNLVLVGHDHVNCSWVDYQGVKLAYGMKSGYGSYWNADLVGGTTVSVGLDGSTSLDYYKYVNGAIVKDNDIKE